MNTSPLFPIKKRNFSVLSITLCLVFLSSSSPVPNSPRIYSWQAHIDASNTLEKRILPPANYTRLSVASNSFANWLRGLPLKAGKPDVLLYNGNKKGNQNAHYAVLNMDVGSKDLQQCADAVMRLRAEYLYSQKKFDAISFKFTSGFNCNYAKWCEGYRVKVSGNNTSWTKSAAPDSSYTSFKKYLEIVFGYCGSKSLSEELKVVPDLNNIQAGDVFIRGGFPGHAVLVMDVVQNAKGEKLFLLAQSYMPAQEMHILKNPNNQKLSPWYNVAEIRDELVTPEWTFTKAELKRW